MSENWSEGEDERDDTITDTDLPPGIIRSRSVENSPPSGPSARRENISPLTPPPVNGGRGGEPGRVPACGWWEGDLKPSSQSLITAIEPQERRKGRVNVYVDGKFAVGLFDDVAHTLGLRIGQRITPERLEEISRAETRRRALEDAYVLLSFRGRSESEIVERLKRKGYEEAVISEVTARLIAAGYLDDAVFAERWVEARGKTRGRRALAFELRQKGVAVETARQALDEAKDTEAEIAAARLAAVKKVGEKPADTSREAQTKIAAFLQRRGFGWDSIKPVLRELYAAENESEITEESDR